MKYIGAYTAAMNGVDAIAFTAGVGENNDWMRRDVLAQFKYLGVEVDHSVNDGLRGEDKLISTADSKVACFCIATNEELAICRETVALV